MSIFNDKSLKSVAEAVSKVLAQESEGTHPKTDKEKQLAALAHPKDKITHKDVLVGRGVLKKENVERVEEGAVGQMLTPKGQKQLLSAPAGKKNEFKQTYRTKEGTTTEHGHYDDKGVRHVTKVTKEDVELEEGFADMDKYMKSKSAPQSSGGSGIKQGHRYGGGKQAPDVENDEEEKKPARGKYGARQNFKRSVKEGFCHLITAYEEGGLKKLHENLYVEEEILEEEPDNEQFTKELKDQEASMAGKKKQPSVAAASTQGVKQMPEEYVEEDVEQLDELSKDTLSSYLQKRGQPGSNPKGKPLNKSMYQAVTKYAKKVAKEEVEIEEDQLDERSLTPGEKKEMEKNVKGMKKKLSGFKDRYGERAKEVMYATATKMAKKD